MDTYFYEIGTTPPITIRYAPFTFDKSCSGLSWYYTLTAIGEPTLPSAISYSNSDDFCLIHELIGSTGEYTVEVKGEVNDGTYATTSFKLYICEPGIVMVSSFPDLIYEIGSSSESHLLSEFIIFPTNCPYLSWSYNLTMSDDSDASHLAELDGKTLTITTSDTNLVGDHELKIIGVSQYGHSG